MSTIEKIQQCMNILANLRPRVDDVSAISIPIANVVNTLADVRDALARPQASETEAESE